MNYKNQRPAQHKDKVVGLDRAGNPIGGEVLETNPVTGSILVSPDSLHPTWIGSEKCLHVEDAFSEVRKLPPQDAPPPETESQPSGQSENSQPAPTSDI